jgi:hypothetical protein
LLRLCAELLTLLRLLGLRWLWPGLPCGWVLPLRSSLLVLLCWCVLWGLIWVVPGERPWSDCAAQH